MGWIFPLVGRAYRHIRACGLGRLEPPPVEEPIPLLFAANEFERLRPNFGAVAIVTPHFLTKEPPIEGSAAGVKTTQKVEPAL